ncbi:hypothetical protein TrVE_jg4008 [Triparma verrucosa]|uniref:Eukaryotic peptide chain release factor subunit 1 n=1 Tax=Triparma verrucosa TaxID=1606542 RepID=A0A9W7FE24_9STRA|nr:hypothetical protein TrVE_jg4008 [Triparma verrucosa]
MKILSRKISSKDSSGTLKLSPQISPDIYHLHNLILPSDTLTMSSHRKVKTSTSTGTVRTEKKRVYITLKVTSKNYDHTTDTLRITGLNTTESTSIRLGASHTFTLTINSVVTLEKERWDFVALMRLEEMENLATSSSLVAIVLSEGVANVCIVNENLTIVKHNINVNIPKKRADKYWGIKKHDSQTLKFYNKIFEGMKDVVGGFERVKAVLIGGPGFCGNDFYGFMVEKAKGEDDKNILNNLQRFVLCRTSSGHSYSVDEMLSSEGVRSKITDAKVFKDVEKLNFFFRLMDTDEERAYYGLKDVRRAVDHGAVSELLVSDDVFRGKEEERKVYVELVEAVKEAGGETRVFSSMHESGRRLAQVSGVAAVLRFPIGDGGGEEEGGGGEGGDVMEEDHEDDWYFTRGADAYGVEEGGGLGGEEEEEDEEEEEEEEDGGFFSKAKSVNERIEEDMKDMGF